jgi:hypothetical protein
MYVQTKFGSNWIWVGFMTSEFGWVNQEKYNSWVSWTKNNNLIVMPFFDYFCQNHMFEAQTFNWSFMNMKFDLLVSSYHYDKFHGCACVFMCGCSPHVNSLANSISMIQSTPQKRKHDHCKFQKCKFHKIWSFKNFSTEKYNIQCFKSSNVMVIYWLSIKVIKHCQEI